MTDPRLRSPTPADHDEWADLFRGYRSFYRLTPSEEVVERVWSWILDPGHEVNAVVAEDDGALVGLAHYRPFARPSSGSVGLWLDDLYAAPERRGGGIGRALIAEVAAVARADGRSLVRWITAEDNTTAQRLYDDVATRTSWRTYELAP